MVAREEIYIDLMEELLAEPDRTHVFIDKVTGLAYKTMTIRKSIPILKSNTLDVAPGTNVIWDGKPWKVVNLGEHAISILSEGNLVELQKETFERMVCELRTYY